MPVFVINAVNLHTPPIHGKLHTERNVVGNIAFFYDLVRSGFSMFRIQAGDHSAVPMFQQLFKNSLPCPAACDGCLSKSGYLPCLQLCAKGGSGSFGVLPIKQVIAACLHTHQFIRVLCFQVQVFLYIGG